MEWVPKKRVVRQGEDYVYENKGLKGMPKEDEVRCDTRNWRQAKSCGNGKNELYCCYFCPKNSTCRDGCRNSPDRCGWEKNQWKVKKDLKDEQKRELRRVVKDLEEKAGRGK